MPVIYEDFIRCTNCGSADFVEETVLTVSKLVKPRDSKQQVLETLSREYRYCCKDCDLELPR